MHENGDVNEVIGEAKNNDAEGDNVPGDVFVEEEVQVENECHVDEGSENGNDSVQDFKEGLVDV